MPVPDIVIFGPTENGKGLTYGEVRKLGENEQFLALKRRLDTFFIKQANELVRRDGEKIAYAPFPLFLMTCVGLETLGKVFFFRQPSNHERDEDVQREGFLKLCNRIHSHFSRQLNKQQKEEFDHLWGENEHRKVTSISHIIYRLGRHTMVHGYRGKGVYLTGDEPKWNMENGAIIINPHWFWNEFLRIYDDLWIEFEANREPTNPLKISARFYLTDLLC